MKKLIIILLFYHSFLFAYDSLELIIDSVTIFPDSVKTEPEKYGYTIIAYWTLKNISKDTVENINPLWYVYANNVQVEPKMGNKKKTEGRCGLGNTLLKYISNDTIIMPAFIGFIESSGDTRRINLGPNEKLTKSIAGFFEIDSISNSSHVQLEYNTLYQQFQNEPIFRGKVNSKKFNIANSINLKSESQD